MIPELIRKILEYVNDPNDMMLLQDNLCYKINFDSELIWKIKANLIMKQKYPVYSSILHHKSLYKHGRLHYENYLKRNELGEI